MFILTVLRVAANNIVNSPNLQYYSSFLSQLDHYKEAEIGYTRPIDCTVFNFNSTFMLRLRYTICS